LGLFVLSKRLSLCCIPSARVFGQTESLRFGVVPVGAGVRLRLLEHEERQRPAAEQEGGGGN